jgi:hypothetical protein
MIFLTAWSLFKTLFALCTNILLSGSLLLSFLAWMGWIRRFLWLTLENALSNAFNGAPVTIGSMEVDLLAGKLFVSNLVIHTPMRQEWKWEAPLIARVGKLHVDFDFLSVIQRICRKQQLFLDIYAVEISDVQVFVERQDNVFNFYLLDPLMELPDPKDVLQNKEKQPTAVTKTDVNDPDHVAVEDLSEEEELKAQHLVSQMFEAVQNIGRDAQKAGWKGALARQRHSLKSKLQELQQTKKTEAMQEGVQVLRKVGKVVAKKTKSMNLVPTPKRRSRTEGRGVEPLFVRVGRVLVQDGRIFTRSEENTWNKPITMNQVWIRATELCPPMSLNDESDKPALYQNIEKVVEVVAKRLLAEMAKSQSGRLFHTAVGEVLGFMKSSAEGSGGESL